MDPGTGMAVFATTKDSAELLIFIIKTVQEVRRLRSECEQLGNLATLLQSILNENKNALLNVKTEQNLQSQLSEVAVFVAFCTKKANLLERAWEVVWEKRLPRILGNLKDWVLYFVMEASAQGLSKQDAMIENQIKILKDTKLIPNIDSNVDAMKRNVEDSLKKQENGIRKIMQEQQMIASMKGGTWSIDFPPSDPRLDVSKDVSGNLSGLLSGEAVVCMPIAETLIDSHVGARHVNLYSRLSANTLVHPFYGLADRDGTTYAVMKDLRAAETLGDSLEAPAFENMLDRVRIAYDLAQTMAYLHSVEILVRSLSDKKVLLFEEKGRWKPFLTELDKARLFHEDTADDQADVRYEAPEYLRTERHSVYTDVWSFGVLLWEWVAQEDPFEISRSVFDRTDPRRANSIRQSLKDGHFPWKGDSPDSKNAALSQVKTLVESCCDTNPTLRPPMASVAQSLFIILSCGDILAPAIDQDAEGVKARARKALDGAGKESQSRRTEILDKDRTALQTLATQGDPIASALLGEAIWREKVPYEKVDRYLLVSVSEQDLETEERARAALPFLDFAAQAGVKLAYRDLRKVHGTLADLYAKLRKESQESERAIA